MIMAHTDFGQLCRLVKALDHDDVDIYIHVNQRSKDWDPSLLEGSIKRSKLYFVNRVNIYYCDYSQVDAQKELLKTATSKGYCYYHMLSGADLPVHPISQIIQYFENNNGYEFVGFNKNYETERSGFRFFLSDTIRTSSGLKQKIFHRFNKMLISIQRSLKINLARNYEGVPQKGFDWWSITHEAAMLVLEREPEFRRYFRYTYCPSELLVQTILYNSPLRARLFDMNDECRGSMREIDWKRGTPYVWRKEDYDYLINSPCMFARKFDSAIDNEIITKIINHIQRK